MSPEAVFRRLREASDLLDLCRTLGKFRPVPVAEDPSRKDEKPEG